MSNVSKCIEIKPTPELIMAINEFNKLIPDPSGAIKSRSKKQYGGRGEIFCRRLAKIITFAILAGVPATLYLSGVAGAGSVFLTQLFKDYIAGSSFAQRTFITPGIDMMRSNLEDIAREDVGVCSESWLSGSIDTIRSWGSSLFGGNDCNQKNLMYVNRLDELVAEIKAQLETNYAEQASIPTMGAMSLPLVERIRRYSRNLNEQVYNILKSSGLCDGPKQIETPLESSVKKWIAGSIGPDDLRQACGAGAGAGVEQDELDVTDADEEESAKMLLEMRVLAELENYDKHTEEEKKIWETALQQGQQLSRQATAQIQKIESYKMPEVQREEKVGGVIHGLRSMLSGIYKTAMRRTPERSPLRKSFVKPDKISYSMPSYKATSRMPISPEISSEYFSQDEGPNDVPYIANPPAAMPPVAMVVSTAVPLMPTFPTTHYLNRDEIDEIVEEAVRKSKRKRDESSSGTSSSSQKHVKTKRRLDTKPSRKSRKLYRSPSKSKRKTSSRSRKYSKSKRTLYH